MNSSYFLVLLAMNDYVLLSLFSVPLSSNTSFPVVNVSEYLASLEGVQDIPEISHTAEVTVFNREDTDAAAATRQNSRTNTSAELFLILNS